ncbi:MAG: hypothetical protein FWH32_07085 [Clostridiales bacterium]|nr:hypothetical protein [Clostridiales bacterium]
MDRNRNTALSICAAVTAFISACIGFFYTFGGEMRTVNNIYGQAVTLLGDGIYANDSLMKAGAGKGTDLVVIVLSILLVCVVSVLRRKKYAPFVRCGLLSLILYASACLAMGSSFNRLFLLYVLQFGFALFAFLLSMSELLKAKSFADDIHAKRLIGTAVFLIISACSTLVWLPFIIPAVLSGEPMEIIDVYTTEPAFVIDLAVILPSVMFCGIGLIKKIPTAYQAAPVFLAFLTGVGMCVVSQIVVQTSLGIVINPGELFGLVVSFVMLGAVSLVLNIKLLRFAV